MRDCHSWSPEDLDDLGLLGHEEGNQVSLSLGMARLKDTKVGTWEINVTCFEPMLAVFVFEYRKDAHLLSYMLHILERKDADGWKEG